LDHHRDEVGAGPAVTILGSAPHEDKPNAATLREREAADVAAVIRQALDEGWQVFDERTGQWRSARRDDIAVLVPAWTSLPFLEDALENAAIPYRAEASSLVYQASEVRGSSSSQRGNHVGPVRL
jgi:ATP-dependent exoDNAse (exonuclease V) beta subunit